jgi:ribosomal protein L40E
MSRRSYACAHCGHISHSSSDHMIHAAQHEPSRVGEARPPRLRRGITCTSCLAEIPPDERVCRSCGREHPLTAWWAS